MSSPRLSRSPDLDIQADRGPHLVRVCSAMIALSATAVAFRFLSRRLSRVRSLWDDWLILIALVNDPCTTSLGPYRSYSSKAVGMGP